jgi:hypothetical protein
VTRRHPSPALVAMLRYRHGFRAWIGENDAGHVTMLVSAPVT